MLARICSSRALPAMSSVDFCTSSIRPSTEFCASSAWPSAFAYRRSIFSRTSASDGVVPGAASSDICRSDADTVSCILACSSWLSSWVRSDSFCCRSIAFCSTAFLACSAACRAWSCRPLRSSIELSAETSWVAKTCAVCSYSWAFASSPLARAWSARVSACRAEACSRSTSDMCRDSFISSWRWLPITAAACRDSPSCWRCASSIACWIWTLGSARSSTCAPNQDMKYFQAFTNGLAMVGDPPVLGAPHGTPLLGASCQVRPPRKSAVEHPPGHLLGLGQAGPQPVQVAAELGQPVRGQVDPARGGHRQHLGCAGEQPLDGEDGGLHPGQQRVPRVE